MTVEDNKALVERYINEAWNGRQPAGAFFAPNYHRHLTATTPALTSAEQQQRILDFQTAFPDLSFTVEDLFAQGDRVLFRATMRGTHRGVFRGIAPTQRQIVVTVLDVVRVEGRAFAEQWGGPDLLDLLQQLGAVVSVDAEVVEQGAITVGERAGAFQ